MNVLVACEESQRVCMAFRERGHNAFSCDIQEHSGGHPEELAEFLLESRSRCKLCKKHDEICEGSYHECWNGIDDWLKQEVDEDAGNKTD